MQWLALTEVVTGKVIVGELSPNVIDAEKCHPSYSALIVAMQAGSDESDLVDKYGFAPVHACRQAAHSVNGAPLDYVGLLEKAARRANVGRIVLPAAKKWEQGEDADLARVLSALAQFDVGDGDFVRLSDISPEATVWVPSSYPPLDSHVGGFPRAGLSLIAGPPGQGKTSLLLRVLSCMAQAGRQSAFFSLEMTSPQIALRMMEVETSLSLDARSLIHVSEGVYTPEEVYASASRLIAANPRVELIGIDFADLLVEGEEKTSKASAIYRTFALMAKKLDRPVVLLSQLNRQVYEGGVPRMNHIRWSGLAEALASLVLLIYNPSRVWVPSGIGVKGNPLAFFEDSAYILVAKSRFGTIENNIGAILVDWNGGAGWGMESRGYFKLEAI